jgi:glycosyltransferase involved in cell wall biosynthesis
MKKKILVRGPVLSQSGYGEHTRFVLRALRLQEDELDIHILPTTWGETGWLAVNNDERAWIDDQILVASKHMKNQEPYDMSVQVTIPNEWERMAPINIGVTAGIECNKVAPVWLEKANMMDKVITISEHSRSGFVNTSYQGENTETGKPMELHCTSPVEVHGYPVKRHKINKDIVLDLEYDFNYLAVAQWGPRKNLHNLIKWFVEENFDQEVGLVVKTSLKNNSVVDREYAESMVRQAIPQSLEKKCKIYLLHGDMSEAEIHSLYSHPKIKTLITLTHGEGFGLPLFEAAYSGLPVIAPGWSGQCDFLYAPFESKVKKKKRKKNNRKAYFAEVDFTVGPIPEDAVWAGVLDHGTMWAFPSEGSYKMRLRQVRKNYNKWLEKAAYLKNWVCKEFESDKMHKKLSESIYKQEIFETEDWLKELDAETVEFE